MAHDLFFGKTRRDWSRETSGVGSILLPEKQEKRLLNKIDDVRYDIRKAGNATKIGLLVLSAALGSLAVASFFRTSKGDRR
jgi:hypothetical protein